MKIVRLLPCAALLLAAPFARCDENAKSVDSAVAHTASASNEVSAVSNPLAGWVVSTEQTHPGKQAGVPNFGKLNDHIWRSGQPTKAGYEQLAKQGLKTVVNLRAEYPQDKDLLPAGVNYIFIPIRDEHAPTPEQAEAFIKAASDPANWPLLVHCQAGKGRAGTLAALVRCTLDKWGDAAVMRETNGYRGKVFGLFATQLAGTQRSFILDWERQLAAAASNKPQQHDAVVAAKVDPPAVATGASAAIQQ